MRCTARRARTTFVITVSLPATLTPLLLRSAALTSLEPVTSNHVYSVQLALCVPHIPAPLALAPRPAALQCAHGACWRAETVSAQYFRGCQRLCGVARDPRRVP